jgi:hypothetical protein
MATEITTTPFANHEAVPTPTVGNSTVYTVVGSDMKWEKKSAGFRLPYIEPLSVRKARLEAEAEAAKDADFEARASRLGYSKNA